MCICVIGRVCTQNAHGYWKKPSLMLKVFKNLLSHSMISKSPFPEECKNLMTLLNFCPSPLHRGMQNVYCTEEQKEKNMYCMKLIEWIVAQKYTPYYRTLGTFELFVEENSVQKKNISLTVLGPMNRKSRIEFYVWHTSLN